MTTIQTYLSQLDSKKKELFTPIFESFDNFYTVVYLIVRNQHITEQEKPDRFEERLQVILHIRNKVEKIIDSFGLNGEEIVADIASDYFEDFIQYKEIEVKLTDEEFVNIIQQIQIVP